MIAKISKGSGFRGTLNYILNVKKGAYVVGGNMIYQDPRGLSKEFSIYRKLNDRVKKPVWHTSLSLPKGEKLSDEKWDKLSIDYMKKMGFDGNQYTVARHQDTQYDHVHIVANRVNDRGKVWKDNHDQYKSKKICRELEQKYGLKKIKNEKSNKKPLPLTPLEVAYSELRADWIAEKTHTKKDYMDLKKVKEKLEEEKRVLVDKEKLEGYYRDYRNDQKKNNLNNEADDQTENEQKNKRNKFKPK